MRNQLLGNRYRILDRIGEGGMAYVYVAIDEKLGRKVAIKVLHEHMERNPDIRKRFQLEAQAVSSLEHPNIVKIYDFAGSNAERLWIVTEVIRGKNVAQFVQQFTGGWLHPVIAACIVREVCKALEKAHGHKIVHRDIKPENIMVTHEGRVKLMDFGIAKDLGKTSMTLTGTFMGSPSYMSPEQIRGRDVDHRSDLYSLAVLFYEIVTGRLPFTGQTTHDVVMKIMEGGFTHPRYIVPSLPDRTNDAIVKGMAKDPAARFQSAREFGAEIDQQLKSLGFDESHVELERYFVDRAAYEARLAKTRPGVIQGNTLAQKMRRDTQATLKLSTKTQGHARPPRTVPRSPTKSPFKVDDGWQQQMRVTQNVPQPAPPAPRRTVPPPPAARPAPTQRAPGTRTRHPTQALTPAAAHYAPPPAHAQPAVDPSSGRRQAGLPPRPVQRVRVRRQLRHVPRVSVYRQPWMNGVFGAILVGVLGVVTLWGFWELQSRLVAHQHRSHGRAGDHPQRTAAHKPTHKRKDGTPFEVRTVVHQPTRDVPPPAPAPQALPQRKPAATAQQHAPVKKPVKRPRPAELKPEVIHLPSETPLDPKLEIDTVEIRKPRKIAVQAPAPDAGDDQNAAPPRPDKGDKPDKTAKPPKIVKGHKQPHADKADAPDKAPAEAQSDDGDQPAPKPDKSDKTQKGTRPPKADAEADDSNAAPAKPDKAPEKSPVKTAAKPAASGKGKVTVASQPAAEVFIDGKRFGTTVDATSDSGWLTLAAGKHNLELRRQGYSTYRSRFDLASDEAKALPRVMLEPGSGGGGATDGGTALTLRVSAFPAQVTIENVDTNTTQAFTMKAQTKTVQLQAGHYEVRIEKGGEVKERELNLTGGQGQLTFSADFKDAE